MIDVLLTGSMLSILIAFCGSIFSWDTKYIPYSFIPVAIGVMVALVMYALGHQWS